MAWLREHVRAELPCWGGRRVTTRILVAIVDAAFAVQTETTITAEAGALERARYALADFHHARTACEQVEAAMIEVLTGLGLHELAGSIPGVSAVSVAAILGKDGTGHVAFGGVAHKPWRVPAAEALLQGQAPSPDLFDRAADAVLDGATGQGHNDFKIPLLRRTLNAVLAEATEGSK